MDQMQMWRLNIQLLIGILACGGMGIVFLLFFWTGLRAWLFHKRQQASEEKFRRDRVDAQGRPWPPSGPGVCGRCGQVRGRVFFLANGERLCEACYAGVGGN